MFSAHNWQSGLGSQALSKQVCRRVQRLRLTLTVSQEESEEDNDDEEEEEDGSVVGGAVFKDFEEDT